eukprot:s7240_g4.t1
MLRLSLRRWLKPPGKRERRWQPLGLVRAEVDDRAACSGPRGCTGRCHGGWATESPSSGQAAAKAPAAKAPVHAGRRARSADLSDALVEEMANLWIDANVQWPVGELSSGRQADGMGVLCSQAGWQGMFLCSGNGNGKAGSGYPA